MPKLKFGKYEGFDLSEVPTEYLHYMVAQAEKTVREFGAEIGRRQAAEEASLSLAEKIISVGYRSLAKEMHPDISGGDTSRMQELNSTIEHLRGLIRTKEGGI